MNIVNNHDHDKIRLATQSTEEKDVASDDDDDER